MPANESSPPAGALSGVRIAIARIEGRGGPLVEALKAIGAVLTELSLTRVELLDVSPIRSALAKLVEYDWLVLTSASAVHALRDAAPHMQVAVASRKLAVVGTATGDAVESQGWQTTIIPERQTPESLLDAMSARSDIDGARVLYLAAESTRDVLPAGLQALGATVDVVPTFRTTPDADAHRLLRELAVKGHLDLLVVSTPGTVDAVLEAVPAEHTRRLPVACIGPATSRAARLAGFPVKVESDSAAVPYLIRRIIAAFQSVR